MAGKMKVRKSAVKEFDASVEVAGKQREEVQAMVKAALARVLAQFDVWRPSQQILSINGPTFTQTLDDPFRNGHQVLMSVTVSLAVLHEN